MHLENFGQDFARIKLFWKEGGGEWDEEGRGGKGGRGRGEGEGGEEAGGGGIEEVGEEEKERERKKGGGKSEGREGQAKSHKLPDLQGFKKLSSLLFLLGLFCRFFWGGCK